MTLTQARLFLEVGQQTMRETQAASIESVAIASHSKAQKINEVVKRLRANE